eukprot:CAMPEP_0180304120 /NCGR_PEP_ID=MMETSP0988-20121125/25560_1 /TAXON_ID=697907 /ORGANISM="non described non described, Strain CCMP2293" /LENGTH=49 /DNA_ID= /DNA_START= /DNA_END= /DNA_ORIENTATION=
MDSPYTPPLEDPSTDALRGVADATADTRSASNADITRGRPPSIDPLPLL